MNKDGMLLRRHKELNGEISPEAHVEDKDVNTESQLNDLTVKELRELAKDTVTGYSSMTKPELIEALEND